MVTSEYSLKEQFDYNDNYTEISQQSQTKFMVASVRHDTKEIVLLHKPFKCRDYLNDFIAGCLTDTDVSVYGFVHRFDEQRDININEGFLLVGPECELCNIAPRMANYTQIQWFQYKDEKALWITIPEGIRKSPSATAAFSLVVRSHWKVGYAAYSVNLPIAQCTETSLLTQIGTNLPLGLLHKMLFEAEYQKYWAKASKKNMPSSIGSAFHNNVGIVTMSKFLGMDKEQRETAMEMEKRPLFRRQKELLVKALRKYANG